MKGAKIWTLVAVLVILAAILIWRGITGDKPPALEGNPDIPDRPEEAVRMEEAFKKLLEKREISDK